MGEFYYFFIVLAHGWGFRRLSASIFSLLIQRKGTKRKDTQHARPAGSLWCSNEPAGCWTRCAQTDASRRPRPILCFSASLNGRVRSKAKTKYIRLRSKEKSIIFRHSGMLLAGIHFIIHSGYRHSPVWRMYSYG